jgi:hypothetical protein
MARGGKRNGAGRPEGSLSKATLEKKKIEAAFTQRVLNAADRLFNAQLAIAEGLTHLYRIDEVKDGDGKKRREHVLVTDPEEIKQFLDEHEGSDGTVDNTYYYLTTKAPDNRAIDSLLDRAFGKATNKTEVTGKDGKDLFPVPILNNMNVQPHDSNQENKPTGETDQGSTGRDISE